MPMGYYEQKINYKWPYNATVIFILFNDIFTVVLFSLGLLVFPWMTGGAPDVFSTILI